MSAIKSFTSSTSWHLHVFYVREYQMWACRKHQVQVSCIHPPPLPPSTNTIALYHIKHCSTTLQLLGTLTQQPNSSPAQHSFISSKLSVSCMTMPPQSSGWSHPTDVCSWVWALAVAKLLVETYRCDVRGSSKVSTGRNGRVVSTQLV